MKHAIEDLLRSEARRELREAPAGIRAAVRARLADAAPERAERSRVLPFALAASLAAAALGTWFLWPRPPAPSVRPNQPALAVVDLTRKGIQYAARIDRPLADEWQLLVADSLHLRDALLGQLPNLPR
jgi:hypothetical protein